MCCRGSKHHQPKRACVLQVAEQGAAQYGSTPHNYVRKVDASTRVVTTITMSGDSISTPTVLTWAPDYSFMWIGDTYNFFKCELSSGDPSTCTKIAGGTNHLPSKQDGTGTSATFDGIRAIAASSDGNTLYIGDHSNQLLRKVDVSDLESGAVVRILSNSLP